MALNWFQRAKRGVGWTGATQADIAQRRFDTVVRTLQQNSGRRLTREELQRIWVKMWQRSAID